MHKIYTTKYVNTISLICSIIVFALICLINKQIRSNSFSSISNLGNDKIVSVQFNNSVEDETKKNINETQENIYDKENTTEKQTAKWTLEIPRIFLEAEVAEGTSQEILNSKIGHFEETSKTTGNVCLAGHNRGYDVNYFQNLKLLKIGDEIKYKYENFTKEYKITENVIIKDTDLECLEETEENCITLITCVENEPQYRRCVRGVEILNED